MMSCERVEEMLPPYVDGDLSAEETREVDLHLDSCGECVATLGYLRRADAIVAGWPQTPRHMQPHLARIDEGVLPRIRQRRRLFPLLPRFNRVLPYAGLATFVLVLGAAVLALSMVLPGLPLTDAPKSAPNPVVSRPQEQLRPESITWYHDGRVADIGKGTEKFKNIVSAVEQLLQRGARDPSHPGSALSGDTETMKRSGAVLELIYPKPGVKHAGVGPHTHVLLRFDRGVTVLMGDAKYTEKLSVPNATEQEKRLRDLLGLPPPTLFAYDG